MRRTVLPWESVPGSKYYAIDTLKRSKKTSYGGWLAVAVLAFGGAVTRWKIALIFAVLYALALLMQKDVAVTERGLEIYHDMRITTNYERWDWADIYAVTHETDPAGSGRAILYFTKGDRTKRNYYRPEDVSPILKLAKQKNPAIRIFDGKTTRDKADAIRKRKK
ncbi:MAG: hypothetical protein K6G54_05075 [Oscillospiraceae bacterium]|nr:hypothetical protein [Oscillospiraceae bacterium]